MEKIESKTFFVVGAPRSGTGYLSRAVGLGEGASYLGESHIFDLVGGRNLDSLSYYRENLVPREVFPESLFQRSIAYFSDKVRSLDRVEDAARHLVYYTKLKPYDLTPSDQLYKVQGIELSPADEERIRQLTGRYKAILKRGEMDTFAQGYISDFREARGSKTVVEKSPAHLWFLPIIRRCFPEIKVVLIHREKRYSVASFLKTFGRGSSIRNRYLTHNQWLKKLCRKYNQATRIESWAEAQDWIYSIAYKEFITTPLKSMRDITAWLGLEYDFEKYASYFPERKVSTNWERLSQSDRAEITRYLSK